MARPRVPLAVRKGVVLSTKVAEEVARAVEAKRSSLGLSQAEALRQAILAWVDPPTYVVPAVPTVPSATNDFGVPTATGPATPVVTSARHMHRPQGEPVRTWFERGTRRAVYLCSCGEEMAR